MANGNLHKAKEAKNDEFYTMLTDIEKELKHYKDHFKGKVVYCNCDDCYESNFFKYFALNFNHLGLKKLVATCFDGSKVSGTGDNGLFDMFLNDSEPTKKAYKIEINEFVDVDGDGDRTMNDIVESLKTNTKNKLSILNGNGSYDSDECIELLKEADIVVTNPPFSLFRDFVATLEKYEKKYLLIGNSNAITYKEIFPLLKENKMWLGNNYVKEFRKPDGTIQKFGNICWFTNLEHDKRNEEIILYKKYNEKEYPKYDNYSAWNVDKVADIPEDDYFEMTVSEEEYNQLKATYGDDCELLEIIEE